MNRRRVLGVGTVAAIAGTVSAGIPADAKPVPTGEIWVILACPGCDLPVAFLPDQKTNRCAHCKTRMRRGLV